jgi:hypothetical protein
MTLDRYGRTTQRTNRTLTHRVSSTGVPQSDDTLNKEGRNKIHRQIYTDRTDSDVFRIPPHTLVMDVTMTNDRYGRTIQRTNGTLTRM